MDLVSPAKDLLRITASESLVRLAMADEWLRALATSALHRADLPTPADLRRLSARLAALHTAARSLG